MKRLIAVVCSIVSLAAGAQQGNLEINTPTVAAAKSAMQARFGQLEAHFASGAIGLTRDGLVQVRDVNLVPLAQRGAINGLVSAENADRSNLYREIAKANNHPEWEAEIARTFAGRWGDKARPGWWVQDGRGVWVKK